MKDRKNAYWIQPVEGKIQSHKWLINESCLISAWPKGKKAKQLRDFEESVFADEPVAQAIPNFPGKLIKRFLKNLGPKGTIIIYPPGQCLNQGVRK